MNDSVNSGVYHKPYQTYHNQARLVLPKENKRKHRNKCQK